MAQKVMINGTYYDLKPSPVLIDGTKYQIGGGRTLIGGTGYDISLKTGETWLLNNYFDGLEWGRNIITCDLTPYMDSFKSNGQVFQPYVYLAWDSGASYIKYGGYTSFMTGQTIGNPVSVYEAAWLDQGYRTVTFPRTLEGTPLYAYFSKMGTII